jgi:hypothetical protein
MCILYCLLKAFANGTIRIVMELCVNALRRRIERLWSGAWLYLHNLFEKSKHDMFVSYRQTLLIVAH